MRKLDGKVVDENVYRKMELRCYVGIGSRSRAAGHSRTKGCLGQVDMYLCLSAVDVLSKFVSGAVRVMSIHME